MGLVLLGDKIKVFFLNSCDILSEDDKDKILVTSLYETTFEGASQIRPILLEFQ